MEEVILFSFLVQIFFHLPTARSDYRSDLQFRPSLALVMVEATACLQMKGNLPFLASLIRHNLPKFSGNYDREIWLATPKQSIKKLSNIQYRLFRLLSSCLLILYLSLLPHHIHDVSAFFRPYMLKISNRTLY